MRYSKRVKPLLKINLARYICNHLVGKEHTHGHRIVVGMIIMMVGLWLGDAFVPPVHFLGLLEKGIGGLIDGVGAVPVVEYLIVHGNKNELDKEIKIVERELAEEEIEQSKSANRKPCVG